MRILFVCTGNICRSPTADGIMRQLVQDHGLTWEVDSAGTHDYHIGDQPDRRTIQTAAKHSIDLSPLRARKVTTRDFQRFDLILAMDDGHLSRLRRLQPANSHAEIGLFLSYGEDINREVPDPYYDGPGAFEEVFQLCSDGCERLFELLNKS